MVDRRRVMGGGFAAGLAALAAPLPAEAAGQGDEASQRIVGALNELRQTVQSEFETLQNGPWTAVAMIRDQQRRWLRATQKYPDFIEVGVQVWDSLHDWHVRYQQPINVARMTDGRYAMVFMFTTVILRPELLPEYVGLPYDADGRR